MQRFFSGCGSLCVIAAVLELAVASGAARGQEVRLPGTWYDQDKYHFGGLWSQNYYDDLNGNGRYDAGEPWDDVPHAGWVLQNDLSCWAAVAANMLRYVGGPDRYYAWMYVEGVDLGEPHRRFWTESGGAGGALWYDGYGTTDIGVYDQPWEIDPTELVEEWIKDSLPVGIGIGWGGGTGHGLTVYAIDRAAQTMTIGDSDKDQGGNDFATLAYTWNAGTGMWTFSGYSGSPGIGGIVTFSTNDFIGSGGGGAGSNWSNPANWSAGHVPASNELPKIHFTGLGTVNLDNFAATLKTICRGTSSKLSIAPTGLLRTQTMYVGESSQIWVDGGVLNVMDEAVNDGLILVLPGAYVEANWMRLGSRDYGAISQSGGDFSTTTNGGLSLGEQLGVEGAYQLLAGRVYAAQLEVGRYGIGTFTQSGGSVSAPLHLYVGELAASTGTYNLSNATSTLQAATEFIGREGTGTFNHYDGSNQCDGTLWIGHYDNSHGEYYLHAGTLTTGDMEIGGYLNAYGFFRQLDGECIVEGDLDMAQFSQWSHGSYQLDAGALRVGGNEIIGGAGTALFHHYGGLHEIGGNLTLGGAPNSYGAYVIQGGTLDVADGTIAVGFNGDGVLQLEGGTVTANRLEIAPGGLVQVETGGNLHANLIDLSGGGSLVTTGPNSTVRTNGFNGLGSSLTINGNLGVGWSGGSGVGSLTIGSGQSLGITSVLYLGDHSTGTLTVTGGGSAQINQARIGDNGAGTLVVTGDASVVTQQGDFYVGYSGAGATGNLRIEYGGHVDGNGHSGYLGVGIGTIGTALVDGRTSRWTGLGALYVGGNASGAQGSGTLSVSGGGQVEVNSTLQVWNTGRVELLGGEINAGSFVVQSGGAFLHTTGTLTVDGGPFNPGTSYNYSIDGSTQDDLPTVVLKNGASSIIPNTLFVGFDHRGELRIENGAWLQSFNGRIGWNAGTSDGRVTVDGDESRWTNTADLEIGTRNVGQMTITGGGVVQNTVGAIAAVPGSSGQVTVSNLSLWQNSGALYVGGKYSPGGTGTLTIDNAWVTAASVEVWPQGTIELDGGYISAADMNLDDGTLRGSGGVSVLGGELTNAGLVSPGESVGVITVVDGDYVQTATGTLAIDIGGTGEYDVLDVPRGAVTLDGGLQVSLQGDFTPQAGDEFWIVSAGGDDLLAGEFDLDPLKSSFPSLPGLAWDVGYRLGYAVLTVLSTGLVGDYNGDGVVDAADYTVWRDHLNEPGYELVNEDPLVTPGEVTEEDFGVWKSHFGQTAAGSGARAAAGSAAVPEPASLILLAIGAIVLLWRRG